MTNNLKIPLNPEDLINDFPALHLILIPRHPINDTDEDMETQSGGESEEEGEDGEEGGEEARWTSRLGLRLEL